VADDDRREVSLRDRGYIEGAVAEAKRRNPTINVSIVDFVRDALLLRHPAASDEGERGPAPFRDALRGDDGPGDG
jgi:hypothetical protein